MPEEYKKIIYEEDYDKGRRAILTPAGAIVPAAAGAEQKQTNGTNFSYYTLNFDKDTEESAFWELCLPDDYTGGTILVNLWWKSSATEGDAVFKVQVLGHEEGEPLDAALGAAQSVTDTTPASAGNIAVCAPSAFSPEWSAGDYVVIKLARDATNENDTLAVDAEVIMVVVEY